MLPTNTSSGERDKISDVVARTRPVVYAAASMKYETARVLACYPVLESRKHEMYFLDPVRPSIHIVADEFVGMRFQMDGYVLGIVYVGYSPLADSRNGLYPSSIEGTTTLS